MAIIKACSTTSSVRNTGKECDTAMIATAMLIALQSGVTFTEADMSDPDSWMDTLIHQRKAFPFFGNQAPINTITNNQEADGLVTLDDGTQVFLRYGVYNRIFETTAGGLCYGQALQGLNRSGYRMLEIDQEGKMLGRKNSDGTYSGIITTFMYAPSPVLPDFKTNPYKNRFQYSLSPIELVNNGIIFTGAASLLDKIGLIDAKIISKAAPTTTELTVGVITECAGTDLVAKYGADWSNPTNFVVTDKATGDVETVTAALANGNVVLTGTFVTGKTYNVVGASPFVWKTNDIDGYDGSSNGVDFLIP